MGVADSIEKAGSGDLKSPASTGASTAAVVTSGVEGGAASGASAGLSGANSVVAVEAVSTAELAEVSDGRSAIVDGSDDTTASSAGLKEVPSSSKVVISGSVLMSNAHS